MKKIISLTILAAVVLFAAVPAGQTKNKSYYSGDALNYNGQLVIASANTGNLEIFKLNGNSLDRVISVRPLNARFNRYDSYYQTKLSEENGHLYAYAITDFKVDKYDISALSANPALVNTISNTYWEWYGDMDQVGDHFLTIGSQGVKLLNSDMQVVDSYNLKDADQYNIRVSEDGRYLLDIQNNAVQVFDRQTRSIVSTISLNYNKASDNRRAAMDASGNIFVTDDFYTKEFSLDGTLKASFRHLDQSGYDTVLTDNSVYFSNGVGVVKLSQDSLKLQKYRYTGVYGGNGWAMGLKAVPTDNGDRVVVFNGSGILVLNQNLQKTAFFASDIAADEISATPTENLWLKTDTNSAQPGVNLKLSGGGFAPNELVNIYFDGQSNQNAQADNQGQFSANLIVPVITMASTTPSKAVDIKAVGATSGLHYSTSFTVSNIH